MPVVVATQNPDFGLDETNGDVAHWVRLERMVSELYDVVGLPGVIRPMARGSKTDEIQRLLTISTDSSL